MKPSRLALLAMLATHATLAGAQSDEWEHTVLFYLFDAGFDGQSQIGPTVSEVDESLSDVLEDLDVGGMGSFRAAKEPWAHTVDVIYATSSDDVTLESGVKVRAEIDQLIGSYDIGYQFSERLEVLLGLRFNSIDLELIEHGPSQQTAEGKKEWVDPYVGLSTVLPFNETFALMLRGDVSGFDVGSKLAWQAIVRLNWSFSENFYAAFGYRILDTDYEDGSGASFFKYDVTLSGPGAGFGWRF